MNIFRVIFVSMILALSTGIGIANAQSDDECIDATGNGVVVCGPFSELWNLNGGEALFGAPLSDQFSETQYAADLTIDTQYFERYRVEHHPEAAGTPYEMQLGRLGAEVLETQGINWHESAKSDPSETNYMDATGFAIAPEFMDYWTGNGLELGDDGTSFRESLALFGYPISQAQESNGMGETVLVQWFERARLELHNGTIVQASLGAELLGIPGIHDPVMASTLAQLQRSVAPYSTVEDAEAAGWVLIEGLDHCFDNPGVGAMGYHYINPDMLDTSLNPILPEALVFQADSEGNLTLGAVEWIVPADAWDEESPDALPEVFGHPLHLNEDLGVYVLHAWIFLDNPLGTLEDWNPDVTCS
ncbi:MAG: hypothetical protein ACOC9Y_02855 [Chloroflexota bacterium]